MRRYAIQRKVPKEGGGYQWETMLNFDAQPCAHENLAAWLNTGMKADWKVVGPETQEKPPTRDFRKLVIGFFTLRLSEKRDILKKLDIPLSTDSSIPDVDRFRDALTAVREAGKVEELAQEVEARLRQK